MSDASSQADPASPDAQRGDTPARYTADLANQIEPKWQGEWARLGLDRQPNPGEPGFDASKPKFYCLDMFPYPSGAGLHVGHPEGYTATDIICRYKRMRGFNVLHPMGWDAFGLPAEQHAIRTGEHPAGFTRKTIDNFRRQLQRFGFCYDWSREFATIDEDYYTWTQWIFLKIYASWFDTTGSDTANSDTGGSGGAGQGASEPPGIARPIEELEADFASGERSIRVNPDAAEHDALVKARRWDDWASMDEGDRRLVLDSYRLAYIAEQTVNWCPRLGTVLANEEVIDGKSERGQFPVHRKPLRQWCFRITAYADRLLAGLAGLDWPQSTRTQQTEWIGRSEGAELDFLIRIEDAPDGVAPTLTVYTTRPDTVFGVSAMVVAPEHPYITALIDSGRASDELIDYVEEACNRSDVERQEAKEKTGVATGTYAINPASGEEVPIWCADYVLMGYGTGAIMMVPAHDQRDFDFAKAFGLPIRDVVYSMPMLAVHYFAREMGDPAHRVSEWQPVLADLLGYVVSKRVGPEGLPEAFERVRVRRSGRGSVPAERAKGESGADLAPGELGERRGVISGEWLEFVKSLGFNRLDELWACLESGSFFDRQGEASTDRGYAVNSSSDHVSIDDLSTEDAKAKLIEWAEQSGAGRRKVNYKLRDWLFSRQRYWGEPFPIVFDEHGRHHAVGEQTLPLVLPKLDDYEPAVSEDPTPLLGKATEWVRTTAGEAGVKGLPADAPVRRETNTMPGWAGSCWYHLRYCDNKATDHPAGREAEPYWLGASDGASDGATGGAQGGVDLYVGGAEHAVLHLLYARFWHKVLFDLGVVSSAEPYRRLFHQGLITSYAYQRKDRSLVPVDEVENRGTDDKPEWVETATGEKVSQITAKMSKSLRNVVNPDDVIAEYGADTFRLYEMYMGPLEASKPWNTRDIVGQFRFCQRVWTNLSDPESVVADDALTAEQREAWAPVEKLVHRTIAKVGPDIERLSMNTAIAAMIELNNEITKRAGQPVPRSIAERFCLVLAPFAPHLAEELWDRLGFYAERGSVHQAQWPGYDESMLVDDEVEIPVQILGKVRSRITVPADAGEDVLREKALADDRIAELIAGKTVRKVVVVPGRLVNIVAN